MLLPPLPVAIRAQPLRCRRTSDEAEQVGAGAIDALERLKRFRPRSSTGRAPVACLPFEVPKLAVTAQITEQDFATLLDRRSKRLEEMKLLEANGAMVIDARPQVETKPALARTNDRRFRRF